MAALSISETITWGIVYYAFPVFLRPMEHDLGASRVAITAAFSIGLGVAALAGIPAGRWIDRHGGRGLMTLGSCLAVALTFAWARVQSLPALYAVWFFMGLAMAATLYEPAFAVVVSWFRQGPRDRALLTVTLAAGFASTIFMPIEAWLLERVGWRDALTTLAIVLAVTTIPIHAFVLRRNPVTTISAADGSTDRGARPHARPGLAHPGVLGPGRGVLPEQLLDGGRQRPPDPVPRGSWLLRHAGRRHDRLDGGDAGAGADALRAGLRLAGRALDGGRRSFSARRSA